MNLMIHSLPADMTHIQSFHLMLFHLAFNDLTAEQGYTVIVRSLRQQLILNLFRTYSEQRSKISSGNF